MSSLINVKLSRFDGSPWGFRLQGGKDFGQPLVIQKVAGGSLAEKAGLQAGDAVIKVNNTDLFNLRHKEAQDSIVRAGNTFELTVQRGGGTWKPQVTPVGSMHKPNASAPISNIQPVTKTSLAARKTESAPIGSGHNLSAKPFGSVPQMNGSEPTVKAIVNKQYNTPVGMYSEETIAETLSAQAEVLAGGVLGVNFKKNERNYDSAKSEVFKMIQEIDKEPHEPEPGSDKENGISHSGVNNNDNASKSFSTPPRVDSPDSGKSNHSTGSSTKTNYVQSQTFLRLQAALDEGEDPEVNAALGSRATGGVYPLVGLRHVSAPETKAPSSDQPSPPYAVPKTSLPPGQNICADCERLIVATSPAPQQSLTQYQTSSQSPSYQQTMPQNPYQNQQQNLSQPSYPQNQYQNQQQNLSQQSYPSIFSTYQDNPAETLPPRAISPVPPFPRPFTPQPDSQNIKQPNNEVAPSTTPSAPGSTDQEVSPVEIRCSSCQNLIVGVFVRIKDKNLHVECFKCATCGTSLKNVGYYNINSKLYCDIHAKLVARHHPPAPNLEPVTVPPGGKAPAGAISAAIAHSMASPGGPGTPTPLATTPLSPQPGTMAPLPFHPPPPPPTQLEQSESDYHYENANTNGQDHVDVMKVPPESQKKGQLLPENSIGKEMMANSSESNLSKEYKAPRVGTSHVHAPRPIAQSAAPSAPKPFSSVSAPAPSTSVSRPTSDYVVSTLRDSVEKKEYPHCESCGNQIPRGPFITALGKTWCPDHFVCVKEQCRRPLQDIGFVEEQGQLYCEYCFEKFLAPVCNKCKNKIKGDCLNAIGQHFHPECFACAYCGKLFGNNPFFLEEGLPYCEIDWNELFTTKCFACGFPIEAGDRWVEALNNNYHSQCFNCSMCKKNLEGQSFYAKSGRPYCKNHAR